MSADLNINVNVRGSAREDIASIRQQTEGVARAATTWRETLTAVSTAYVGLRSVLSDVGSGISRIAAGAVENERHARAVATLGEAYSRVQAATNGVVTAEQALRVQQELVQSGLRVNSEELAIITRRTRDYANATGVDLEQALGQMTEALRGGTAEGMRRFGADVQSGTTRVDAMAQAMQRWRAEQERTGPATRTLGEEANAASRAFSEMTNRILGSLAQALRLREAFAAVSGFLGGDDAQRQQQEREFTSGNAGILRERTRTQFFQQLQAAGARGELRGFQYDRLMDIGNRANTSSLQRLAIALQSGRGQAAYRGVVDSDVLNVPGSSGSGSSAPAGGGGGGGRPRLTAFQRLEQQTEAFGRAGGGGGDDLFQDILSATDRPANNQGTALSAGTVASIEASRQRERDLADARRQQQELSDVGRQMNRSFEGIFGANRTLAQNFAATMRGAFDTATNSFKAHLSALITGRESFGQALRGFVHEVTLNLAVESAPKAIFELAEGIASQASTFGVPNPKSVMHFTSAAMYAGLAVGGGVVAALTAPSPAANPVSGDAGGASPRLSGEFRGGGGGGGNTTNVFNFQSAIVTKEDAQDAVRRATQGAFNRGGRIEELAQIQRARAAA